MPVIATNLSLTLSSKGNAQILEITEKIQRLLRENGCREGIVTLFVPGSTAALTTVEYEPGLVTDLDELWERLAPAGASYHHEEQWHDGNGHSHVRASLLGPSLTIPVVKGAMTLGTWQQVIFIDFDVRPRERSLVVQFLGEKG